MRPVFKFALLLGVFRAVAGSSGYLTLKFIIKSADTVVVPQLIGKDVVYALNILTELGLDIKVSGFEYMSDVPENHIAHQEPEPGSEVKKGRDVRIIISKGPKTLVAPDLVGMDVRQALIIMEENGLVQGRLSHTHSDRAALDEIMSQVPAARTVVTRGDAVDLLVSLGRRPVTCQMPYLHGLVLEDAILILDRSQLGLGQIRSVQRNDQPKDVVIEQDPPSGYQVTRGTLVRLTMNRADTAPLLGQGLHLFHHRVQEGFLKTHVRFRVSAFGMLYDPYDVFVRPGERVWFLALQDPDTTVFLYQNDQLVLSHPFSHGSHQGFPVNLN